MRRKLIVNWCEEHESVRQAMEKGTTDLWDVGDTKKGWSYVTFFAPGTDPRAVLYDLERLEMIAHANGYFLPREVVVQHNKVVVTAQDVAANPSAQLLGLCRFLEAYAARFSDESKYPNHGFYGKVGGTFDRPEKGRVLVMYSTSDEALLAIDETLDELIRSMKLEGLMLTHHFSNGLSEIPRMLDHFADPDYASTGARYFRITNPSRFEWVLAQARRDYGRYLFEK